MGVRHKRIRFDHLQLNGVRVDVRYGDLLVAQDDSFDRLDWEVVIATSEPLELAFNSYDVHVETSDARQLWGSGLLVRTDGRSHVFRGGGALDGLTTADLD